MKDGDLILTGKTVELGIAESRDSDCICTCLSPGEDAEVQPPNPAAMPVLLETPCGTWLRNRIMLGFNQCHQALLSQSHFAFSALRGCCWGSSSWGCCPHAFADNADAGVTNLSLPVSCG